MQQLLMTQETGGAKDDAGKEYTMQPYPSKPKRLIESLCDVENESDPWYHKGAAASVGRLYHFEALTSAAKANRGLKKNMEEWRLTIL
ncbi:unnamed protein product [Peronospora effusa]|nr:unnamed protein product [Peronospora effusa]